MESLHISLKNLQALTRYVTGALALGYSLEALSYRASGLLLSFGCPGEATGTSYERVLLHTSDVPEESLQVLGQLWQLKEAIDGFGVERKPSIFWASWIFGKEARSVEKPGGVSLLSFFWRIDPTIVLKQVSRFEARATFWCWISAR